MLWKALQKAYLIAPDRLKPPLRSFYYHHIEGTPTPEETETAFIDVFFDDRSEYERYRTEFRDGPVPDINHDAEEEYERLVGDRRMGTIRSVEAERYYALVRKHQPEVVVETGVLNGFSTLTVLAALSVNGNGTLHSVDYPHYTDNDTDEFREETYDAFGGAAIPAGKDPGWIVPEEYRSNWELRLGKSQRKLPEVLTGLDEIDLFIHDSEHSVPCMLFELEFAWEWLAEDGVIIADDISWNDAFEQFVDARAVNSGLLSAKEPRVGYIRR
jgi:predicted O-methyltransferase YrrM